MSNIKSFLENLTGQETVDLVIAVLIIAVLDIFSPLFSYAVIKIFKFKEKGAKIKKNAFYIPLKSFFFNNSKKRFKFSLLISISLFT